MVHTSTRILFLPCKNRAWGIVAIYGECCFYHVSVGCPVDIWPSTSRKAGALLEKVLDQICGQCKELEKEENDPTQTPNLELLAQPWKWTTSVKPS